MIHTDIMVANMKDYDRELFSKVVECVRWCLDEEVLSVSQLKKMKSDSVAYGALIEEIKSIPKKEMGIGRYETAFTKDT